jgi:uroporphyrinogen decarboxylase
MNRHKSLLRALRGEQVWPPPIWLMRQAGRYLPEYRAVRAQAGDFVALCTTPVLAAEVTLQPVRRFGLDAAILFSDILMLPWAMGCDVAYREGEGPILSPLRDRAAVEALDSTRLSAAIEPILETVRRAGERLGAEQPGVALIGFAGAPFTVACYMVEGAGSKDFAATRTMAYRDPGLFTQLIHRLADATVLYLEAQIEAGAEAVMLFDTWAGLLSPIRFRQHVIGPTGMIVRRLKQRFPSVPVIGFPRLAGQLIGEYVAVTKVDAIAMDTAMDPALVRAVVPSATALQGNLDPMALVAGGPALAEEAGRLLDAARGHPFVFNLGHGIVPQTPPEHVAELVRLVRAA